MEGAPGVGRPFFRPIQKCLFIVNTRLQSVAIVTRALSKKRGHMTAGKAMGTLA